MGLTDAAPDIGCVEHLLHATRTRDPTGIDSRLYRGQIDGEQSERGPARAGPA